MIYTIPTKKGLGVELWGTYEDITHLYKTIGKFWVKEEFYNQKGFENRDTLVSGFSYEIRKTYQGRRLIRKNSHHSKEPVEHFGVQLSWVHILFSLAVLRFNMRFVESDRENLSVFLHLEQSLEQAMNTFDKVGAKLLVPFIEGGIFAGNEYIYQYMRSINTDYFILGGGKKAFRMLPELLNRSILNTEDYVDYLNYLKDEAKRLKCGISDLELDDEDIPYEDMVW